MTRFPDRRGVGNPLSDRARRVRGGVRLLAKQWPMSLSWAGTGWLGSISSRFSESVLAEGFQYARQGQVRSLEFAPGRVTASVQGRAVRPYRVVLQVRPFDDAQWSAVVEAMADRARHSARLLAGEFDESFEEPFAAIGLHLFPSAEGDLVAACGAPSERPWCKHAACAVLVVAEAIERDPLLLVMLRGLPGEELVERLRDRRSAKGAAASGKGQFAVSTTGAAEPPRSPPLEQCLEHFWEPGPELEEIQTPLRPPEVSHALLRRLGPSPFEEGKFPIVGLLATCYDAISRSALSGEVVPPPSDGGPA